MTDTQMSSCVSFPSSLQGHPAHSRGTRGISPCWLTPSVMFVGTYSSVGSALRFLSPGPRSAPTDMSLPRRPGGYAHPGPVSFSNCDIETRLLWEVTRAQG